MSTVENIRVVVRVKPLTEEDEASTYENIVDVCDDNQTLILLPNDQSTPSDTVNTTAEPASVPVTPSKPPKTPQHIASVSRTPKKSQAPPLGRVALAPKSFTFDRTYRPETSQREIFQDVESYVEAAVQGYNSTVFAYGQTGAGKTYTMMGPSHDQGIIPRAVNKIFNLIEGRKGTLFVVYMSYVELHLDQFVDLLDPDNQPNPKGRALTPGTTPKKTRIEIREHLNGDQKTVFLSGSESLRSKVTNAADAIALVNKGAKIRSIATTKLNKASSRSHSILTFHVESRESDSSPVILGKLHLVDLAGSERLSRSGAEGETLKETQNINSSLNALADVLSALSAPQSAANANNLIPYRNSKLTRLLQDSLGGNSKTFFIININPLSVNYRETLMALQYGQRTKKIKNVTAVNKDQCGDSELATLHNEIAELKKRLETRNREFEELKDSEKHSSQERKVLKQKIDRMSIVTDSEVGALEDRLANLIHTHQGEIAEQRYAYATLQNNLHGYQEKIRQLNVKLLIGQDEVESLREQIQTTTADIDKLSKERDLLASQRAEMEKKTSAVELSAKDELIRCETKIKELEEALAEEKKRSKQLAIAQTKDQKEAKEMSAMIEKIEKLQEQMKAKQEENKRSREEDNKRIKAAEHSVAELKKEVTSLTRELNETNVNLAKANKLNETLEKEKQRERESHQKQISTSREEIEKLKKQLAEAQNLSAETNSKKPTTTTNTKKTSKKRSSEEAEIAEGGKTSVSNVTAVDSEEITSTNANSKKKKVESPKPAAPGPAASAVVGKSAPPAAASSSSSVPQPTPTKKPNTGFLHPAVSNLRAGPPSSPARPSPLKNVTSAATAANTKQNSPVAPKKRLLSIANTLDTAPEPELKTLEKKKSNNLRALFQVAGFRLPKLK